MMFNIIILVIWTIMGLLNLFTSEEISKIQYCCIWVVLISLLSHKIFS